MDKREYNRQYREKNRERLLVQRREYNKRNRERLAALQRANTAQLRAAALRAYGGDPPVCSCCNEGIEAFLEIHHVNGDGAAHRKEISHGRGSTPMYRWLRDHGYPPGFAILCANCNKATHVLGTCPHQC